LFAGTVKVSGEFGMLDEATLVEKRDEVLARDEMVLYTVDLSWSWGASGI
jgi:hypothetical protein